MPERITRTSTEAGMTAVRGLKAGHFQTLAKPARIPVLEFLGRRRDPRIGRVREADLRDSPAMLQDAVAAA